MSNKKKSAVRMHVGNQEDGRGAHELLATLLPQGFRLHHQGMLDQARAIYEAALRIDPFCFDALHLLGVINNDQGNPEAAVTLIKQALRLRPTAAPAYQNLGMALRALRRPEEAAEAYRRGLELEPTNAALLNNLGNILLETGKAQQALSHYERAICLAPDFVEAHDNTGNALRELHRFEEALSCYERAQALAPDFASAHWNEGLCRLLLGQLPLGWKKYEWGWRVGLRGTARPFRQPLWRGQEPLDGKIILLHAEQGLGDTIQFCRYVPRVAARGATVILEVQPPLKALLSKVEGASRVVSRGEPLPDFDLHCPLLSLPLAFNTDLASIPKEVPYIEPDASIAQRWNTPSAPLRRLRAGIVWAGNAAHTRDAQRSIPLSVLMSAFGADIELFSLQKDAPPADQALARQHGVRHDANLTVDFPTTAALASTMDVIVSVDTSVAHLTGALGLPTWILLPHTPDWRWMTRREDSPWYPTARLFRQTRSGDWSNVIDALSEALNALVQRANPQ